MSQNRLKVNFKPKNETFHGLKHVNIGFQAESISRNGLKLISKVLLVYSEDKFFSNPFIVNILRTIR